MSTLFAKIASPDSWYKLGWFFIQWSSQMLVAVQIVTTAFDTSCNPRQSLSFTKMGNVAAVYIRSVSQGNIHSFLICGKSSKISFNSVLRTLWCCSTICFQQNICLDGLDWYQMVLVELRKTSHHISETYAVSRNYSDSAFRVFAMLGRSTLT